MTQPKDTAPGGGAGSGRLRVSLLGPLEATHDGAPLPLGSRQQRALVAMLALQPGRSVAAELLVEALWRGSPPASAPGTLQSYVSRLRRGLVDRELLVSDAGGYRLAIAPEHVDAVRFETAAAEGRKALQEQRHSD